MSWTMTEGFPVHQGFQVAVKDDNADSNALAKSRRTQLTEFRLSREDAQLLTAEIKSDSGALMAKAMLSITDELFRLKGRY